MSLAKFPRYLVNPFTDLNIIIFSWKLGRLKLVFQKIPPVGFPTLILFVFLLTCFRFVVASFA